jgi:hypothetical protein
MYTFGWVTITADDLAIWQQFPTAAFTLMIQISDGPTDEYRLGSFDLQPSAADS